MDTYIKIAGIIKESIVDGPGIRMVVFAQGCKHNCPGCHNPETHSFDGGILVTVDSIIEQAKRNPLLDGITFSGGVNCPPCQDTNFRFIMPPRLMEFSKRNGA